MRIFMLLTLLFFYAPSARAASDYICPMHPHISGEEGDFCPICGMALTPKSPVKQDVKGRIVVSPEYIQILGVKTHAVKEVAFGKNISAYGRLSANTRREYAVDIRVKGWVSTLTANAVGDHVKKGALLFTLYSPELMEAQSDFLLGRRIGNQIQRLKLYGMDDQAIAELKRNGAFLEETPFHAPADGVITALNVRQGAFVPEGGNILIIQDYSTLWVDAEVPLKDLPYIQEGQQAEITIPETGDLYTATIELIHPNVDPMARTVRVRLTLDNQDGELKADSYVQINFRSEQTPRLVVPKDSIIYGADNVYVITSLGEGRFHPVNVDVGITSNGYTEITGGLKAGQRIVTSGQFMIDAESNLRGGTAAMSATQENAQQMGGHSHVH